MKTILSVICLAMLAGCAKKGITEPITKDKAAGKWIIHDVRYNIYNGSATPQDSSIPWRPNPENFVTFDGTSTLQYSFNSPVVWGGEYSFIGEDSISMQVDHKTTRWKILLLTGTNFNIESTSTSHPSFPGARVITYQGFIR
jgi:hypothetical protein